MTSAQFDAINSLLLALLSAVNSFEWYFLALTAVFFAYVVVRFILFPIIHLFERG